ncbi:hypothetical protein ig2599ANME_1029 [groundwater metagenome]
MIEMEEYFMIKDLRAKGLSITAINKLHENPFTASRLFREIQEMGFTGKYSRTLISSESRSLTLEKSY